MALSLEAGFALFAAVWFFAGAAYLRYKQRELPALLGAMTPVVAYLVGVGLFFLFQGWSTLATVSCPVVDCTDLSGGLAMMLAASFIARYPLDDLWPSGSRWVFFVLVWFSVLSQVVAAFLVPAMQVRIAHVYAFLVAGVFGVGYIVYEGLVSDSATGTGVGLSMGSCCVIAHGVSALPLVATVTLPLVGVPLDVPYLFAVLAPIALVAVVAFVARAEATTEFEPEVESDITT